MTVPPLPDPAPVENTLAEIDASQRLAAIRAGDRRALAQAITLIESSRPDHRTAAEALLDAAMPHAGGAVRLGISGTPGVGKSTFIEAFGCHLIDRGHRVAVLAVDPSSRRSGGSILGDKTRMDELVRRPQAYIRPTPAGDTLGGVARRTRETMALVEAAGFDVVLVETVGVGQSEMAVADMVDMFVLLLGPAGGDDLQGIKRGIMEIADLILVTKADGDTRPAAMRAVADYRSALALMRPRDPRWTPRADAVSAPQGVGVAEAWDTVAAFREALGTEGLATRRRDQATAWYWAEVKAGLIARLLADPGRRAALEGLAAAVAAGVLAPSVAVRRALAAAGSDGAGA